MQPTYVRSFRSSGRRDSTGPVSTSARHSRSQQLYAPPACAAFAHSQSPSVSRCAPGHSDSGVRSAADWIWRHQCDCPGGYPVTCELPNGSHVFEQTKLHAFARYIGPSPAPEPPYKPIKPCPYKPESLDKCVAEAKAMCEDAMSAGYEACKKCVWSDRGELIYDDCSWKRRHGKIVEHVCGPEPGQHTTVEECVDVEGEISYDDEKTFPQEEHFPDDDEAFDDDDWL